ncbi:hypothetical protein ACEPAH_9282 [Sanghuangporus vaninii]
MPLLRWVRPSRRQAEKGGARALRQGLKSSTCRTPRQRLLRRDGNVPIPSADPFDFPRLHLYDRLNKCREEHRAQLSRAEAQGKRIMRERYMRQRREEDLKRGAWQKKGQDGFHCDYGEDERGSDAIDEASFDLMDKHDASAIESLQALNGLTL